MPEANQNRFASLAGTNAVVTGASSGIGRAIALEFARAGANIVVHYAQSKEKAEQVASEIRATGVSSQVVQADLAQADISEFANQVWENHGPIDVWVNNAGVDLLTGKKAQLDYPSKLTELWNIDVQGTVHLSRAIGQKMQEAGSGTIINIGWDQADRGMEGDSAELFSVAKSAIMGFTRSLALSLAPEVRVNCIAPGWISTAWGQQANQSWHERVKRETPLKRWGKPEDIANLARFLASENAAYITGQVINANGGAIR